jgi:glycolate oxidase
LEIAQFHSIKFAFDPTTTLNPGKGIPMLKRCQEYRALDKSKSKGCGSHSTGDNCA